MDYKDYFVEDALAYARSHEKSRCLVWCHDLRAADDAFYVAMRRGQCEVGSKWRHMVLGNGATIKFVSQHEHIEGYRFDAVQGDLPKYYWNCFENPAARR